jgi:hypothetical protein
VGNSHDLPVLFGGKETCALHEGSSCRQECCWDIEGRIALADFDASMLFAMQRFT